MLIAALGLGDEHSDVPIELSPGKTVFVDILFRDEKLIVEIDGSEHGRRSEREADKARDAATSRLGFSTLRFWRWDVEERLQEVVMIVRAFMTSKSPTITTSSPMGYSFTTAW